MSSAQLCFMIPTLMTWCDGTSIILSPVLDAYFPAQIVDLHSSKNIVSCKGKWRLGEIGHILFMFVSSWHCEFWFSVLHWKHLFLFTVIGTSITICIIQYMLNLCWSSYNRCCCSFHCCHMFWQMIAESAMQRMIMPTSEKFNFFIHWMNCEEWTIIQIMHHTFINTTCSIAMVFE